MITNESEAEPRKQFRARRLMSSNKYIQECNDLIIESIPVTFANAIESVEMIEAMVANDDASKMGVAYRFGNDLCDAYHLCSGYLTDALGPDLLLRAFRALKPVWWFIASENEYEAYCDLGDDLVLYRGGIGPLGNLVKGLSWTLDENVARGYMDAPNSVMIRAVVRKTDLILYFQHDHECIVDPATLAHVELVGEIG